MAAVTERDLMLEELSELWREMEWWRKTQIILAMRVNLFMQTMVERVDKKRVVGWVIVISWWVSIVGMVYYIIKDATIPAVIFGMLAISFTMFALFWLVWRWLR